MKIRLTLIAIAVLLFGSIAAPKAEAHSYKSRVISTCGYCKKHVYAYYRPVNYNGCVRYTWVPAYHNTCAQRARYQSHSNYYGPYAPSNYHYRPSYSYRRPGVSITITR